MDKEKVAFDLKKFAEDNLELFSRNLQAHGKTRQFLKCCEEMSELNVELCKYAGCGIYELDNFDYSNIHTEIADVIITLTQIMNILDCFTEVSNEIDYKLERLNKRLINE